MEMSITLVLCLTFFLAEVSTGTSLKANLKDGLIEEDKKSSESASEIDSESDIKEVEFDSRRKRQLYPPYNDISELLKQQNPRNRYHILRNTKWPLTFSDKRNPFFVGKRVPLENDNMADAMRPFWVRQEVDPFEAMKRRPLFVGKRNFDWEDDEGYSSRVKRLSEEPEELFIEAKSSQTKSVNMVDKDIKNREWDMNSEEEEQESTGQDNDSDINNNDDIQEDSDDIYDYINSDDILDSYDTYLKHLAHINDLYSNIYQGESKRPAPGFVGKRPAPGFVGKRPAPGFVGKRLAPGFVGKRLAPGFVGKRPVPGFVGKRPVPGFVGKRPVPGFVGKRPVPGFVGKRPVPGFVGKRPAPGFVGK